MNLKLIGAYRPADLFCLVIAGCVAAWSSDAFAAPADDSPLLTVDRLVVLLIDESEVPATQTGPISELSVREGASVRRGQVLAKIEDRRARLSRDRAAKDVAIAKANSENQLQLRLAQKTLEQRRQESQQHAKQLEITRKTASNRLRVEAVEKSAAVALNELKRARDAHRKYADSVSESEIESLALSSERAELETKQAEFEFRLANLHLQAEQQQSASFELAIEKVESEIEAAKLAIEVLKIKAAAAEHQWQLAELEVDQHQIRSPIDGVVVKLNQGPGDWVTAGTPVMRVVHLSRLRAEGFVHVDRIALLRQNRAVTLFALAATELSKPIPGRITFISPEIDPINQEVRFWVEFANPEFTVLPGMAMRMEIPAASEETALSQANDAAGLTEGFSGPSGQDE